jgi:hypothetical protein
MVVSKSIRNVRKRHLLAIIVIFTKLMKYIFIDTFAIEQLTRECYEELGFYLYENELTILVSPMLLVEYFSPMLQRNDRTERAVWLLLENDFVIANQTSLMEAEEESYPNGLSNLPIAFNSATGLQKMADKDQFQLFYALLHHGIPDTSYDIKSWAEKHHAEKQNWEQHILEILKNAEKTCTIKNKQAFTESLDLRLCDDMMKAVEDLNHPENHDELFYQQISKLHRINEQHDTAIMRGIHLSSLIMWYDYVIAKKKIKPSDGADIMHALLYPYCDVVVADASRVDCIRRVQREDGLYRKLKIFNKAEFKQLMLDSYPKIEGIT